MAKSSMTPEEQLEDLQRRYALLEGERRATYETAQLNIRQNKEIITQLKEENKALRGQVSQIRSEPSHGGDELHIKETEVAGLKRRADLVKDEIRKLKKKQATLEDSLHHLQDAASTPSTSGTMRKIRVLENRLDKSMLKYNEAQSIRRTYEAIVKRLREERVGFDHQLSAIEQTLKSKDADYEELLLLSHDAFHAKEMAQAELHRFEQGVMEERNQRDREVQEKKALVQQRVEMNQRLERRERQLKQQQENERAGEQALKATSAMTDLAGGVAKLDAGEQRQRLADYEVAFRRIRDACGVSDVNEVIQKFLTQDETRKNLLQLTRDTQARIDALQADKQQLRAQVDELKYSNAGSVGKRQVGEDFEAHLTEALLRCERNKSRYLRSAKLLISVKAGVAHMSEKLQSIKLDGEAALEVTDETVEEALSQCELKISKVMSATHSDAGAVQKASLAAHQPQDLGKANVRVKLSENGPDDDEDEESYDEDLGDEVWNRKSVKYASKQIVEKQLRKLKKKKKKA